MWPCSAHSEGPQDVQLHLLRLLLLENLEERHLGLDAGAMNDLRGVLALPSGSLALHRAVPSLPVPLQRHYPVREKLGPARILCLL